MVQRNARAWLGLVEPDDGALDGEDGHAPGDAGEIQGGGDPGGGIQVAVMRPRNFRDAATVGEYYRRGIPVVINLEDMSNAEATRIIDFVSGLILGLCGDIERVSRRTFLIVPAGAAIHTAHGGLADEGFFNQA